MATRKDTTDSVEFPMRINKYLAFKKHCTRREADKLIEKGFIYINGRIALLGDKVSATDVVKIEGPQRNYHYYAYYKPRGIITHSPQGGEVSIEDSLNLTGVFPVGRLDKDSSGLLILTDDGRVTDALLNPKHQHEKEYAVTTLDPLPPKFKQKIEAGVDIGGYITQKCNVEITGKNTFVITLTEGKNHQIRRMCGAFGQSAVILKRIRIMNIPLGRLKEGEHREIKGKELAEFLESIGL